MSLLLTLLSLAAPPVGQVAAPGPASAGCWQLPGPPAAGGADGSAARAERSALEPRVLVATRVDAPPALDGRLDDAAWCRAAAVGDFVESSPRPGRLASLPTLARMLYDDEAVWVGIRLLDPTPDSIVAPFPRRDDETSSDWVFVEIDTRFDRRSGFSFGVNPRGVQVDGSWSDDVDYDPAWNGVWSAAARIDSLGWTAEFRIPYSQLALGRSTTGAPMPWGINIYRYVPHRGETSNWSPRLPTVVGVVSHFNRVEGLPVPPHHRSLEVVPFTALTLSPDGSAGPTPGANGLHEAAGVDVRLRPTGSTALALSIRPDFGQVEADPAQVNLTAFETFLPEQRPLFVEGNDVFRFPSALAFSSRDASFAEEQPFYSRRIGGAPHGAVPPGARALDPPTSTPLQAAARLSGRAGAWSGGLFQAWTSPRHTAFVDAGGSPGRALVEPLTSYSSLRAVRELAGARAAVGAIATLVDRSGMDGALAGTLVRDAAVAGLDARYRFASGRYEATGFTLASRVSGSREAIHALRAQGRHGYGREGVDPDSLATSLGGVSAQARIARVQGSLQGGVAARVVTRGFETNDAGFQRNADWLLATLDWRYRVYRPGHAVRRWSVGSDQIGWGRTLSGLRRAARVGLGVDADLASFWGGSAAFVRDLEAFDPQALRGGPALLLPPRDRVTLSAYTDSRKRWQVTLGADAFREAATRSRGWSVTPDLSGFVGDRLQLGVSPSFARADEGWQYVGQPRDAEGARHWVLGALRQETASLTTRATYAFSSRLTLQLWAQALVSAGAFASFSEVTDPAATTPGGRVTPLGAPRLARDGRAWVVDGGGVAAYTFTDPDFSERDLRVNALLRWEFRPGSTLFAVWTHRRTDDVPSPFRLFTDLERLAHAPGRDAVELKLSWWLTP